MSTANHKKFFIGLLRQNGRIVGHGASSEAEKLDFKASDEEGESPEEKERPHNERSEDDFAIVFNNFVATVESYRRFMPFTLLLAPQIARAMAEKEIGEFAKTVVHTNLTFLV
jgi:hypothetical protein